MDHIGASLNMAPEAVRRVNLAQDGFFKKAGLNGPLMPSGAFPYAVLATHLMDMHQYSFRL
jgi:hypothetical protein